MHRSRKGMGALFHLEEDSGSSYQASLRNTGQLDLPVGQRGKFSPPHAAAECQPCPQPLETHTHMLSRRQAASCCGAFSTAPGQHHESGASSRLMGQCPLQTGAGKGGGWCCLGPHVLGDSTVATPHLPCRPGSLAHAPGVFFPAGMIQSLPPQQLRVSVLNTTTSSLFQ